MPIDLLIEAFPFPVAFPFPQHLVDGLCWELIHEFVFLQASRAESDPVGLGLAGEEQSRFAVEVQLSLEGHPVNLRQEQGHRSVSHEITPQLAQPDHSEAARRS